MRGDLYAANCPSRQVLDRIGDRWSVLVVSTLADGTLRHSGIAGRIHGITPKMLTQTLRGLERDGLVHRTVFAEVPPRVEYGLTDLGHDLVGLVRRLEEWAETHIADVESARSSYDARETASRK